MSNKTETVRYEEKFHLHLTPLEADALLECLRRAGITTRMQPAASAVYHRLLNDVAVLDQHIIFMAGTKMGAVELQTILDQLLKKK